MQDLMRELAQYMGFYFEATTFPELFFFMFLALCGTAIVSSIISVMFYITVNTRKLAR